MADLGRRLGQLAIVEAACEPQLRPQLEAREVGQARIVVGDLVPVSKRPVRGD